MLWIGCWKVTALNEALSIVIRFWYTKELKYVVCTLFTFLTSRKGNCARYGLYLRCIYHSRIIPFSENSFGMYLPNFTDVDANGTLTR